MNTLSYAVLVVCAVYLFSVGTTDALKCYFCTNCNDPFDASSEDVQIQEQCSGSCSKVKLNGDVYGRVCVPEIKTDDCVETGNTETCLCTSDLCNISSSLTVSIAVTGLLTTIGGLYSYII